MMWCVTAMVRKTSPEGARSIQVPTFYLNSDVQGIVDAEHAERIAKEVCNPTGDTTLEVMVAVTTMFPSNEALAS